jgi:hypothetical protein
VCHPAPPDRVERERNERDRRERQGRGGTVGGTEGGGRRGVDDLIRRIEVEADEDEDDDPNIIEHIEDAVGRFETEHVDLVQTINRIANALSAGGI